MGEVFAVAVAKTMGATTAAKAWCAHRPPWVISLKQAVIVPADAPARTYVAVKPVFTQSSTHAACSQSCGESIRCPNVSSGTAACTAFVHHAVALRSSALFTKHRSFA